MTIMKADKEELLWQQISDDGKVLRLRKSYRRRFAMLGASVIGILLIVLFSSYLKSTGGAPTTDLSISPGSGNAEPSIVFPVGNGSAIPYSSLPGLSTLKYSGATGVSPQWAPVPNFAGQVTNGGDIGVVDATSVPHHAVVQITITNLTNLAKSYSSFAFPLDIYEWCPTNTDTPGTGTPCGTKAQTGPTSIGNTAGSWVPYETGASYGMIPSQQLFLTNAAGSVAITLPKGFYYDLAMDPHQGSFYCISTAIPSDLSPSFYISAKVK